MEQEDQGMHNNRDNGMNNRGKGVNNRHNAMEQEPWNEWQRPWDAAPSTDVQHSAQGGTLEYLRPLYSSVLTVPVSARTTRTPRRACSRA